MTETRRMTARHAAPYAWALIAATPLPDSVEQRRRREKRVDA
jgi:hypothetical protein